VSQSIEKESVMQVTHLLSEGCTGCFKINYTVKFISSDRSYQVGAVTEFFNNMSRRVEKLLQVRRCNLRFVTVYFTFFAINTLFNFNA